MHRSRLEQLPPELLSHLLSFVCLDSLLSLSATSRLLHAFITSSALPTYAAKTLGARTPFTLQHLPFHRRAPWAQRAQWGERTSERWGAWDGRGAVVSPWTGGKCLPVVKLWEVDHGVGTVLVASGRELQLWATRNDGNLEVIPVVVPLPPGVAAAAAAGRGAAAPRGALDDVTSLASGTRPGEVVVARHSGLVQRLRVAHHADPARRRPLVLEETARYAMPGPGAGPAADGKGATAVQALHSGGGLLAAATTTRLPPPSVSSALPSSSSLTASATPLHTLATSLSSRAAPKSHAVTLHALSSPWAPASAVLPFAAKPWAVHLSPSRRWLAVGHTGTAPLSLLHLDSTGSPTGSPALALARTRRPTSVYGLTSPSPLSSGWANPDETLLAALYDSTARVYDLRVPVPGPASSSSSWDDAHAAADDERPRNEVLRLSDPWSDDAAYALALGGPQGAVLAVGSARNAAVRLFDLRAPAAPLFLLVEAETQREAKARDRATARGITAFAPGRDRSPVYGLAGEASRFWGVTERRGFVLDFDAFPRGGGAGGRRWGERVAYVGHEEGGGGTLRWMGE
ncbi:hypothetical protein DMC30DRAFT_393000 [Rhodotorula diobovata]|uniref:F-box domain-containing protein n=1 Tax=Rhodotorula diobovata TaxID=5288 RepID=A0A5C5G1C4_9BASI|nr:hypothetical protein DMC30DRAFT_393000 [Rhodotorula diobovata]